MLFADELELLTDDGEALLEGGLPPPLKLTENAVDLGGDLTASLCCVGGEIGRGKLMVEWSSSGAKRFCDWVWLVPPRYCRTLRLDEWLWKWAPLRRAEVVAGERREL